MAAARTLRERARAAMRVALSQYVANGLAVAFGLLLVSGLMHLWLGVAAAAGGTVGVIVSSPPDLVAPRRGKFWAMLPAPLLGLPFFVGVQLLHNRPLELGLLLVPATFLAFLGMAWGKRGIPIAIAVVLAMVFSMATPAPTDRAQIVDRAIWFAIGSAAYLAYAVLANLALNARYRAQVMADLLQTVAGLMRVEAAQFQARDDAGDVREVPASQMARLLQLQAALADQLQATRDIVLESPRTPRRQRLAGMLMVVLELRDTLLASELDLEALRAHPGHARTLAELRAVLLELSEVTLAVADALLLGRKPAPTPDRRGRLAAINLDADAVESRYAETLPGPTTGILVRGLASRLGHINDEVLRLIAIGRGERAPDLAVVRANWQMFVSPTDWSLRPFFSLWRWDAPPLRHAIRAALAVGAGYLIAVAQPWGSHDYWIVLTIVVVLRGSLAQTLERRNHRVGGTMAGSVFAVLLLSTHLGAGGFLATLVVAQAIAHSFATRRYVVTAMAATVLGLTQAHQLNVGLAPTFALAERIFDTLIGAGLAWAFCYVLPSWERGQLPALVARVLRAQARHAQLALGLGQLRAAETSPELDWRLARREAFDSLSALVQATQRALSEPRAVQPPIAPLEQLQAHSYQLLAQLSAIKSMLVLRHDRLTPEEIEGPLARTAERILDTIGSAPTAGPIVQDDTSPGTLVGSSALSSLPDPFDSDVSPWLLRRLDLATVLATQLRDDAARVLQPLREN